MVVMLRSAGLAGGCALDKAAQHIVLIVAYILMRNTAQYCVRSTYGAVFTRGRGAAFSAVRLKATENW